MNDEKNENTDCCAEILTLSADMLKGRQSVRATFKLPSQVIGLLSFAASQLGLKQKSLFDQLVEDHAFLEQVATGMEQYQPRQEKRKQKTFVVSRNALVALDSVAKTYGVPRDLLVEISIGRLLPVLNAELEKQKKRRQILVDLEAYFALGAALLEKTCHELGQSDPFCRQLQDVLVQSDRVVVELRNQVERGKKIEEYW